MIYTELTMRAMRIAYAAHHGQLDRAGLPYIFHPYHLAEQMSDETTICAALLHDVIEDCGISISELERQFPPEITQALQLLTHEEGTPYLDYVRAIAPNPIARVVKMADLAHNMDANRLSGCNEAERQRFHQRMQEKYAPARAILEGWE